LAREANDWISGGRLFQKIDLLQQLDIERWMTVAIDDMSEPAAGVMRISADDDDQASQQHELHHRTKSKA